MGHQLCGFIRAACVPEAERYEDCHQASQDEHRNPCDEGDRGKRPECVGLEQQTPESGALNGLHLGLSRCVGGDPLGRAMAAALSWA